MKTRREKIIEIKEILSGKRSAADYLEPITTMYMVHDGIYWDMRTGKEYTEQEFKNLVALRKEQAFKDLYG